MIRVNGEDITVTYTTSKAEVYSCKTREEQMKFIVDNRPIVIYQFWIDITPDGDLQKMLYSKCIPEPACSSDL
ncbi:MAG: hypothetical protein WC919_03435 [Candidatus Paceibacterota bacterium]|jgi:hypothetical protein